MNNVAYRDICSRTIVVLDDEMPPLIDVHSGAQELTVRLLDTNALTHRSATFAVAAAGDRVTERFEPCEFFLKARHEVDGEGTPINVMSRYLSK